MGRLPPVAAGISVWNCGMSMLSLPMVNVALPVLGEKDGVVAAFCTVMVNDLTAASALLGSPSVATSERLMTMSLLVLLTGAVPERARVEPVNDIHVGTVVALWMA